MPPETRTNNPNESISHQQKERFAQLQTNILERIKPHHSEIIIVGDNIDPTGHYLSIHADGRWDMGVGREHFQFLNQPGDPVDLLRLLQEYAFIQNSPPFDEVFRHEPDTELARERISKYADQLGELKRSVKDNPAPHFDSLLSSMEKALGELSGENNAT